MTTTEDRGPISASDEDRAALTKLERLLGANGERGPKLVGPAGERIDLPEPVYRVLRQAVHAMAGDQAVDVVPIPKLLTTERAAELLNVPQPYLDRLLDEGEIPSTMTDTHRRVPLDALLDYRRRRDAERREALTRLTQMSEELGLYE